MKLNEYQALSKRTLKTEDRDRKDILSEIAMGLAGETGESVDIVKKHVYHGHKLDIDHAIEEAGDVLWYLSSLATTLNISLEELATRNVEKLKKRYPKGFEVERSVNREESKC